MMAEDIKLEPIKITTASTKIMEQLHAMIRRRELRPGRRLPSEMALAKQLGTSRSTVREALTALKVLQLVESRPGKGNFITSKVEGLYDWGDLASRISMRSDFLEALEARQAIEGEICQLAAQRANENDLERIESVLDLTRQVSSPEDFRKADYQFHLSLAKASSNSLFVGFIEDVYDKLTAPYWRILEQAKHRVSAVFEEYFDDHREIYKAIARRRPDMARKRMITHLERIRRNSLGYFVKK